jgi:ferredoxin
MTHVITNLCLRDNGCSDVCPVECIQPGDTAQWPTYYIDPSNCIDCGACVPECPFHAIYPADELPAAFKAKGGEYVNEVGLTGHYEAVNHRKQKIVLETTRVLTAGEVLDLRGNEKINAQFFQ